MKRIGKGRELRQATAAAFRLSPLLVSVWSKIKLLLLLLCTFALTGIMIREPVLLRQGRVDYECLERY